MQVIILNFVCKTKDNVWFLNICNKENYLSELIALPLERIQTTHFNQVQFNMRITSVEDISWSGDPADLFHGLEIWGQSCKKRENSILGNV